MQYVVPVHGLLRRSRGPFIVFHLLTRQKRCPSSNWPTVTPMLPIATAFFGSPATLIGVNNVSLGFQWILETVAGYPSCSHRSALLAESVVLVRFLELPKASLWFLPASRTGALAARPVAV